MHPYDEHRLPGSGSGSGGRGSWLQRALLALSVIAIAIVATFFLTVALIAGALLALVVGARLWWALRKLRQQAKASAPLEAEYTVIERDDRAHELERER